MPNSHRQTPSIDLSLYVRTPVVNLASGISLTEALIAGCPNNAPKSVLKACDKLKQTLAEARQTLAVRHNEERRLSEQDRRLLDQEADNSWAALRYRLLGYSLLPKDKYPSAQRAEELISVLFGSEGLSFLKLPYQEQSVMMTALLQRIQQEKLEKELEAICGSECMKHLHDVVPRYQKMVEQGLLLLAGPSANLRDQVRMLSSAILNYTTKVVAMIDEDDPSTIEKVQKMLRPIDAHREQNISRKTKNTETNRPIPAPSSIDDPTD